MAQSMAEGRLFPFELLIVKIPPGGTVIGSIIKELPSGVRHLTVTGSFGISSKSSQKASSPWLLTLVGHVCPLKLNVKNWNGTSLSHDNCGGKIWSHWTPSTV
jgi:hypothetical protein